MPYSHMGVLIERSNNYLKVSAKLGLTFLWNGHDALLVRKHPKHSRKSVKIVCLHLCGVTARQALVTFGFVSIYSVLFCLPVFSQFPFPPPAPTKLSSESINAEL